MSKSFVRENSIITRQLINTYLHREIILQKINRNIKDNLFNKQHQKASIKCTECKGFGWNICINYTNATYNYKMCNMCNGNGYI
jgi:hypothetical protein